MQVPARKSEKISKRGRGFFFIFFRARAVRAAYAPDVYVPTLYDDPSRQVPDWVVSVGARGPLDDVGARLAIRELCVEKGAEKIIT